MINTSYDIFRKHKAILKEFFYFSNFITNPKFHEEFHQERVFMSNEEENLNHPEPDPADFEIHENPEDKKPSYLEGKISRNSVLFSLAFVGLCFFVSSLYWSDPKNFEFYIMQKDLYSSSLYEKSMLSVLSHSDIKHFLSNAPLLFIFGALLYNYYGFLVFPCLSFFSTCMLHALCIYLYNNPAIRLLGASSMLYFMAALWLVWYFRYETKKNTLQKILRVGTFTLVVLFPSTFSPQTSYLGHTLGFVGGALSGLLLGPLMDQKILS